METSAKLIIATQFYPPDTSTTAVYLGKIAEGLAAENNVLVIAATPKSRSRCGSVASNPTVDLAIIKIEGASYFPAQK